MYGQFNSDFLFSKNMCELTQYKKCVPSHFGLEVLRFRLTSGKWLPKWCVAHHDFFFRENLCGFVKINPLENIFAKIWDQKLDHLPNVGFEHWKNAWKPLPGPTRLAGKSSFLEWEMRITWWSVCYYVFSWMVTNGIFAISTGAWDCPSVFDDFMKDLDIPLYKNRQFP